MIKVNEDADMLKVLRRIPYKVIVIKSGYRMETRIIAIDKDSAMQGMKL
jgi:hypothetical protein